MLKKILAAALWLPLMALAQSYPSPTFNNVTVNGTLTGKVNSTGSTITNATITGGTISGLSSPLPVASGGTNSASASGTALDNIAGFSSTGFMSRTGAGAYSFTASTGSGSVVLGTSPTIATPTVTGSFTATGLVTTADLATQAANTVLANATAATASPTAFAMPVCSGANALAWPGGAGFTCVNPTSYYNVFNSMTAAQISDVQACTLTQDVTSVIQAAENTYGAVWLPKGCFRTSAAIDLSSQILMGAGAHITQIVDYDSTAADSVITMGGSAKISGMSLGFNSSIITGSETQGQRNGIQTYSPVSSLALQRGSRIENLYINYTGTGIYNPITSGNTSMFSSKVTDIEIQGYSYRGMDIAGPFQTGSVFDNVYINNYTNVALFTASADAGAQFGQCTGTGTTANTDISEISINQLNVEWATVANAVRFCGVTGVSAGTMHLEEITLRNNFSGLIDWRNSSGRIGSLSVYYPPIKTSGWYVARLWDSTNLTANVANLYNEDTLDIGVLNLHGLNDGPQVSSGNGLTGVSNFFLFDRETSAVGPYYLRIGNYVWQTYQSDSSVYSSAPNDPHSMLTMLSSPAGFVAPVIVGSGTGVATTAGTLMSVGSIILPPGDWDVSGVVTFVPSGGGTTGWFAGSSTSNSALGPIGSSGASFFSGTSGSQQSAVLPTYRYNVTANTTVYALVNVSISAGTVTTNWNLRATQRH